MRLILPLLFLLPVILLAQENPGIKAEYIHQNKKSNRTSLEAYLFTDAASLGTQIITPPGEPVIESDDEGNFTANILFGPDKEENLIYHTDYKHNKWTARLLIADEFFIVSDTFSPFKWEITGDTKLVAGYNCYAASTYFRGRNYIAYFTPEIPVSVGPYKFGGLPGLILEIKTTDEDFAWHCKSISQATAQEIAQIVPPEGKKPISQKAFQEASIAFIKRALDKLRNLENITVDSEPVFNEADWLEIPEKQ